MTENTSTTPDSVQASCSTQFRTKDMNLAAFMWCQPGARLLKLQSHKDRGLTIFFLFEMPLSEVQLTTLQLQYANGETTVEPAKFVQKQENLRDLLHNSLGIQVPRKNKDKNAHE